MLLHQRLVVVTGPQSSEGIIVHWLTAKSCRRPGMGVEEAEYEVIPEKRKLLLQRRTSERMLIDLEK